MGLQTVLTIMLTIMLMAVAPGGVFADSWRRVDAGGRPGNVLAAVARSARGQLAVAADDRVRWWPSGFARPAETFAIEGVRDLAFGPSGALWIGSSGGLWRWEAGARPVRRPLRGDAGASDVFRLAGNAHGLLVATGAGAYWSTRGRIFQPLASSRIGGAIGQVAFRARRSADLRSELRELWLFGDAGLETIRGLVTGTGLRVLRHDLSSLPRPRSEARPVDLVVAPGDGPVVLVYPDTLAFGSRDGGGDLTWRSVRPVLAPGAAVQRLAWDASGPVLATDRGLFAARTPAGPWRRLGPEPGAQPCADVALAADDPAGAALCRSGLHVRAADESSLIAGDGAPVPLRPDAAPEPLRLESFASRGGVLLPDPPVASIRARALARAGLDVERDRALRRGLWRRGWLPEVGLQFGADFDRDSRRFADESYVSGGYRSLFDRTRERATRFEAQLQLDWTLGDIAFPDDSVDLSRELRQVLSLRNDVSDEIHQLYFERARIRARLAAGGPFEAGEPARLRVRAAELAAGLDAWTGGWLSQWHATRLAGARPDSSSPSPGSDPRGESTE